MVKFTRAMAYPSTFTFLQRDLARYFRGVDHRSAGLLTETNPTAMKFNAAEPKGRPRFSQDNLSYLDVRTPISQVLFHLVLPFKMVAGTIFNLWCFFNFA